LPGAGFAWSVAAIAALAALLAPRSAEADDAVSAVNESEHRERQPWTFDARVGPALLLKSQSHAPRHLLKPDLRLGGRIAWSERWELGAAVDALLDSSEHYRVLGLMAQARFAPLVVGPFSLGASGALGVGYDADILHASLEANGRVAPYGFVALDGRCQVGRWLVGAEGALQNFAIVQLGALVGVRFPG
jgi:hypothetical protein